MTKQDLTGLMKSLNLNEDEFKPYDTSFDSMDFAALASVKHEIETQLDLLAEMLDLNKADMSTPLTRDGFPRDDIDVLSIRLIRVKVIHLRNDHKAVLKHLEAKMADELQKNEGKTGPIEADNGPRSRIQYNTPPFVRVGQIVMGSPAFQAGLKEGDRIVTFDRDINATNNRNLSAVVTRVKNKVDKEVSVSLLRGDEQISLTLVPTENWDGQGLLGCRLIPL